ncbi:TRAP transporter, DctM subunit [Oscillibacter sp. PC13]|uniref:TRAP transporter large permease n=1 Tax=Oscillibacter sp. PC13 TaxID=1855299 RepID=UPI0008F22928|nr:TRAP transporter large permease [Oscillibacter sp. PC13]SFP03738.1 TRAP transporter, DctM subunit [Oscillibacter sp. PC13]
MNVGLITIFGLLILSICGIPIFLSLGIATLAAMSLGGMPLVVIPQKMFAGMNSTALLAIPFFMLAGNIMSRSITMKLVDISNALIGWVKGSLAVVTVLGSTLFGAISGSAVATCSAIGGMTIPAMKKEGYSDSFAAAIASMASVLGPLIPPSITLIVYASATETSISALFQASVVPGLLLCLMLIAYCLIYGKKKDLPAHPKMSGKEIANTFKSSIWALLMPVIILGGIFGGVFTATEAAAVSVVYALFISFFVYKDMKLKELLPSMADAGISTAVILVLVGLSKSSSYVVTTSGLPQAVLDFFTNLTDNKYIILLLINLLFLLIGMLMEANAAVVMMTPLLRPLMLSMGLTDIQFCMMMCVNLYIGLMTPPVGVCVLLGNQIAGAKLERTLKNAMPMLGIGLVVLLLVTYVPAVTTWLPGLFN